MMTPKEWTKRLGVVGLLCVYIGFLLLVGVGCAGVEPPDNNPPKSQPPKTNTKDNALTYYKDIKPIFNRSCVGCHSQGGIGPWVYSSYDKIKSHLSMIGHSIKTKQMPPWQPSNNCQEYVGNNSLTDKEIKTITDWIAQGAKQGDPSTDQSKPVVKPSGISRVDFTVKPQEPYKEYAKPDDYRCFVVNWPLKEKAYITGMQVNPDNKKVAHHVIVAIAGPSEVDKLTKLEAKDKKPGYSCYGSPGQGVRVTNAGSWVPGGQQRNYPEGAGILVQPGSKVIIQMHYNVLDNNPGSDQTSVSFKVDKVVEKDFQMMPLVNPRWIGLKTMEIPAGAADVTHSFSFDPGVGLLGKSFTKGKTVMMHGVGVHMHERGKSARIWVKRKDGSETCLLDIPRWDFKWQGSYAFKKPIVLQPGDKVAIECKWDNSAPNQPIINGKRIKPINLNWGEGTQDEMCLGSIRFLEK